MNSNEASSRCVKAQWMVVRREFNCDPDRLHRELEEQNAWYGLCTGEVSADEFCEIVAGLLSLSNSRQRIVDCINAELEGPNEELLPVLKNLSQRYRLACLSNTNPIHWDYILQTYPAMEFFEVTMA